MLPSRYRLRRSSDFKAVLRRGRRVAGRYIVIYLSTSETDRPGPQVGFVVGRNVGGAVIRNRTRRRLRHIVTARLAVIPARNRIVVRALPAAAAASFAELAAEFDRLLGRLTQTKNFQGTR